jgi:hypothetical protein
MDAAAVADDAILELTFSAEVAAASVTSSTVKLSTADGDVSATLTVDGDKVRIAPRLRMAPKRQHTLSITTGVQDTQGRSLAVAGLRRFVSAGKNWATPEFVHPAECWEAELLNSGTLAISCRDGSVLLRNAQGVWQAPQTFTTVPVPGATPVPAATVPIRLDDDRIAVIDGFQKGEFVNEGAKQTRAIWSDAGGWTQPVAAPNHDHIDWNTYRVADHAVLGSRPPTSSEISQGLARAGQRMLQLVDTRTGNGASDLRQTDLTGNGALIRTYAGPACVTTTGNRVALMVTVLRPSGLPDEFRVNAYVFTPLGGWQPQVLIGAIVGGDVPAMALSCAGDAAFVRLQPSQATNGGSQCITRTLSGGNTWRTGPVCSTTNELVGSISRLGRTSPGRSGGLVFWNDFRSDPQGLAANTSSTRYAGIPRMFETRSANSEWVAVTGLPGYQPGSSSDFSLGTFDFEPQLGEYIGRFTGGPIGSRRAAMVSFSPLRGWSNPWSLPAIGGVTPLNALRIGFNATGRGVAIGVLEGQTYISEWR